MTHRNGFLLFISSCLSGCGQMYQGYMKRGLSLLLAFCQGKGTIDQKFTVFAKGAANENVLTMLMIYILAGAFSTVASAMGGVDATVNLGLSVIPVHFLAAGVFVISAFMGTATGTSMGTISAIVPIAVGVAERAG